MEDWVTCSAWLSLPASFASCRPALLPTCGPDRAAHTWVSVSLCLLLGFSGIQNLAQGHRPGGKVSLWLLHSSLLGANGEMSPKPENSAREKEFAKCLPSADGMALSQGQLGRQEAAPAHSWKHRLREGTLSLSLRGHRPARRLLAL